MDLDGEVLVLLGREAEDVVVGGFVEDAMGGTGSGGKGGGFLDGVVRFFFIIRRL
jgi:hypothetical protein